MPSPQQNVSRRRACLLFNPAAGRGNAEGDLEAIREALEAELRLDVVSTEEDLPVGRQVQQILGSHPSPSGRASDTDLIIAAGGDGTVSGVAGALMETGIPLGIVPRGTSNAFARALDIPLDIRHACDVIVQGRTRTVDAGRTSRGPMVLMASVGIGAAMISEAEREEKSRFGPLAYIWSGARQLAEQKPFLARIEAEEKSLEVELTSLTVANVAPGTSLLAQGCGEVVIDDGTFEVTLTSGDELGLGEVAALLASAIRNAEAEAEGVLCFRTPEIRVATEPPQVVVADGEESGETPLEIRCVHHALKVLVR